MEGHEQELKNNTKKKKEKKNNTKWLLGRDNMYLGQNINHKTNVSHVGWKGDNTCLESYFAKGKIHLFAGDFQA